MSYFKSYRNAVWWLITLFWAELIPSAFSADTVQVVLPPSIYFAVADVQRTVVANPNPVMIRFHNAQVAAGRVIRISVRASSGNLRAPSGRSIPVGGITWTATGASGGTAFNGTLNPHIYTPVYQSASKPTSGGVDLSFTMDRVGLVRAGQHHLNLEWKIEAVTP